MRVFQVCADPGIPPDGSKGASVHLRSVARALSKAGHQVVTLTRRMPRNPEAWPAPIEQLKSADPLVAGAEHHGTPDLVYERYSLGHDAGLEAARRLGSPFALELNAPLCLEAALYRPGSARPRDEEVETHLLKEADLVFAVSEPLRRYAAERRGTDAGTIVLRNGCDPARWPLPAALDGEVIAFLGHPKPWHGTNHLAPLLAAARQQGHDARLLLIGGGQGTDAVVSSAQDLGVSRWVELTGPLSESRAAARLSEAAVAVAPYPPDPFFYFCPLKVVEYMAAGLPVVASAQGDVPDILGDTGVLVAPGDQRALEEAVVRLLRSPKERFRLGRAARERAFSRFTWERVGAVITESVSRVKAPLCG